MSETHFKNVDPFVTVLLKAENPRGGLFLHTNVTDSNVIVEVQHPVTKEVDRYFLTVDCQGGTYTLLLSAEADGRRKGLISHRALIDAIGKELF